MSKMRDQLEAHETSKLETKLAIADKVEGELRKTISVLEGVNATQSQKIYDLLAALDTERGEAAKTAAEKDAEIARLKLVIEAQDKVIKYRGERLAERGY